MPTQWRKSSKSQAGNCVEVARSGGSIAVRDSKAPDAGILQFPQESWRRFSTAITQRS
ncbi:DUF397 domain-containing protein [Pseudonocardiaceae bacterium YIM PH 21723]|nr:DUF397 domain-containing protein [Pseudonocardiaceae bacterium YIM PH 21723]